jgi:hypothetical protein
VEGFEEGGLSEAAVKSMPVACFLARGKIHSLMNTPSMGVGIRLSFAAVMYDGRNT